MKPSLLELAEQLTEPQRRCVLTLSDTPKRTRRYSGYSSQAAFNLVKHGITALGFDPGAMVDTYCLTDLGLSLQAALRASNKEQEQ
jgi:hypothetical protein